MPMCKKRVVCCVCVQVDLEEKLLKELSASEGNILDNEELIMTLDKTKGEAEDIKVSCTIHTPQAWLHFD